MPDRTRAEICRIVSEAFTPLRCVAEFWDYGNKFRFKVFDKNDEPVYEDDTNPSTTVLEDSWLNTLIVHARTEVGSKGHRLDEWEDII